MNIMENLMHRGPNVSFAATLAMGLSADPSLSSRLKQLNINWMDCDDV